MNLIICCTPLQVLIAKEIILSNGGKEKFYGVMLSPVKNEKYEYYYSLLKEVTSDAFFIYRKQTVLSWGISFLKLKIFLFFKKRINSIYLSNINDELIHLLIDSMGHIDLYTFDDGTANIIKTSAFYSRSVRNRTKILRAALRIKTTMNTVKEKSLLHYTIYPNISNIIDKTKIVSIFNTENYDNVRSDEKIIKVFLGQPFYNSSIRNKDFVEKIVKKLDIDFYIPHPREDYRVENVTYVESKLVFEELFAKEFSNKKCIIYTFYSGAILNLLNLSSVQLISILPKELDDLIIPIKVVNESYDLFKRLGIEVLEI